MRTGGVRAHAQAAPCAWLKSSRIAKLMLAFRHRLRDLSLYASKLLGISNFQNPY